MARSSQLPTCCTSADQDCAETHIVPMPQASIMEQQLLRRLEAAVDRLERLEVSWNGAQSGVSTPSSATTSTSKQPAVSGTSAAPGRTAAPAAAGAAAAALPAFDQLLEAHVAPLAQLSSSLAPEVQAAVSQLVKGMQASRSVIQAAATRQRPDTAGLQQLLAPVGECMMAASKLTEGRRTATYNYVKVVADMMQALSWLAYTGPESGMSAPSQHVADSWQSAEFYSSKLLMESRSAAAPPGTADAALAWTKAIKELVKQLELFVGRYFPQGLTWGTGTGSAPAPAPAATKPAAATPPPPPKGPGGPPPPPPPPPGPPPKPLSVSDLADGAGKAAGGAAAAGGASGFSALFKELQQGEDITKSLRKVTDDMKTKNRADRTGVVSLAPKAAAAGMPAAGAGKTAGPPRMQYDSDRKKWVVENQVGQRQLVLADVQPNQAIYIFACKDCVIQVPNKANAISIDSCTKTGVMFADLISQVEVVNSRSLQLQCTGYVPTVSIEKTDGVQLYVHKKVTQKEDFQVITAKCSEVNVHVLPDSPESMEDPMEHPVPEQFISTFTRDGALVTRAATHSGA